MVNINLLVMYYYTNTCTLKNENADELCHERKLLVCNSDLVGK